MDQSPGALPRVIVTVISKATGAIRTDVSDGEGKCAVSSHRAQRPADSRLQFLSSTEITSQHQRLLAGYPVRLRLRNV